MEQSIFFLFFFYFFYFLWENILESLYRESMKCKTFKRTLRETSPQYECIQTHRPDVASADNSPLGHQEEEVSIAAILGNSHLPSPVNGRADFAQIFF